MIFLSLFCTFFMIGLFGFGGGYGMLSLIQHETVEHWHWLTSSQFTDIVAISQMTPGPIGINSATYCGYTSVVNAGYSAPMGVLGSAVATFALVLPSLILMILISKMFMKYMHHHSVERTAGCRHLIIMYGRQLLDAHHRLVAVHGELSAIHCGIHRSDVHQNQSHPHDTILCYSRTCTVLLVPPSGKNKQKKKNNEYFSSICFVN